MSRPRGKNTGRQIKPGSPEGDAIGMSDRTQGVPSPIPGGRQHLGNQTTVPQEVPIPAPRGEYRGILAHGVEPGTFTTHERADAERGPNDTKTVAPRHVKPDREPIIPVPVYVVTERSGARPLKIATPRHVMVPGFDQEPVRICGRDFNRTKIKLQNNHASSNIRIAQDPTALIQDPADSTRSIGGALVVHGLGYMDIETQDELWARAMTPSTAIELQIITESSIPGGGGR